MIAFGPCARLAAASCQHVPTLKDTALWTRRRASAPASGALCKCSPFMRLAQACICRCPETCGCADPFGELFVQHGCPTSCHAKAEEHLKAGQCVDAQLGSAKLLAYAKQAGLKNSVLTSGCKFAAAAPTSICQNFQGYKSLQNFCPKSCKCTRDRPGCPRACPSELTTQEEVCTDFSDQQMKAVSQEILRFELASCTAVKNAGLCSSALTVCPVTCGTCPPVGNTGSRRTAGSYRPDD